MFARRDLKLWDTECSSCAEFSNSAILLHQQQQVLQLLNTCALPVPFSRFLLPLLRTPVPSPSGAWRVLGIIKSCDSSRIETVLQDKRVAAAAAAQAAATLSHLLVLGTRGNSSAGNIT